jgi:large subunit ribosomal protein L35
MGKLKSNRALHKKVKVTRTGKVMRKKAGKSHLMTGKKAKRRRNLGQSTSVKGKLAKKMRNLI